MTSFDEWKQLAIRLKMGKIFSHVPLREEDKSWKEILRRNFHAFLSKQNLSFRGHREYLRKLD